MRDHTFTLWLQKEVATVRCILLEAYEKLDKLKYVDGPRLDREYMDKIGYYEETVIKAEIECELLQKKQMMIQAAINRREPIDEAAIDAELEGVRQQMLEAAGGNIVVDAYPKLSPEESQVLHEIYREIMQQFHPETHPEMTEVQRELFAKAREAYTHRDLDALKLVQEMLYSTVENGVALGVMLELMCVEGEESADIEEYNTDYRLASMIYGAFQSTEQEVILREQQMRYKYRAQEAMQEIEVLQKQFPYIAADTLGDPVKIEEYREKLAQRLRVANDECERRKRAIRDLIESVAVHEQ